MRLPEEENFQQLNKIETRLLFHFSDISKWLQTPNYLNLCPRLPLGAYLQVTIRISKQRIAATLLKVLGSAFNQAPHVIPTVCNREAGD